MTFQRIIRVGRVVVVTTMIYQAGYHNGMVHFAQDPVLVEQELIKFSLGLDPKEKIEKHTHGKGTHLHNRVRRIGDRIIVSAKEHCANQLKIVKGKCKPTDSEDVRAVIMEEILQWERSCHRLEGKWTFFVVKSPQVNAFVSGYCPRKVFVYEGLIKSLELTDDELAMIMGHELSHVILGHVEEQIPTSAILLGTQLVIMALVDPIGIGSFLFDALVAQFRIYIEASYSRQHESDADELGLLLTSLSCYDIQAGAAVHQKLAEHSHHRPTALQDSHPSSVERFRALAKQAELHAADRRTNPLFSQYHRDCTAYRSALRRIGFEV